MFEDLYDAISFVWSWRWPTVNGRVTAAEIERIRHSNGRNDTLRLSLTYGFSIADGPYSGEDFWTPTFTIGCVKRIKNAKRKFRSGRRILVRYRPDDPSVNRLDRSVWEDL
jgi:Protein of unknown function (DUF3592)